MSKTKVVQSEEKSVIDVSQIAKQRGPRAHGKGKGLDLSRAKNYFPPMGSIARQEIDRIADAKGKGVLVESFRLSEIFLGSMVASGLVNVNDGVMTASERCYGILDGSIQLESNRQPGTGFYSLLRQLKECTSPEQAQELGAKLAQAKVTLMTKPVQE